MQTITGFFKVFSRPHGALRVFYQAIDPVSLSRDIHLPYDKRSALHFKAGL